ncbi:MAG TPA: hypothetical protein VJ837_01415, partial [Candidatus Paceibacterota bacterium]|nr:hypothetical protein [Candidatus Paceibacterota bacterium]
NVVLASDSRTALPLIESAAADVVVVEIRSGSAGGFDLAREMSQRLATSSIPILMLLERPQDEWLARQAGASGIEVKPIDARELALSALALIRDAQPVNN